VKKTTLAFAAFFFVFSGHSLASDQNDVAIKNQYVIGTMLQVTEYELNNRYALDTQTGEICKVTINMKDQTIDLRPISNSKDDKEGWFYHAGAYFNPKTGKVLLLQGEKLLDK